MSLSDQFSLRASAPERALDRPRLQLDPSARKALPVWLPVSIGGAVGVGFSIAKLAGGSYGWEDFLGIAVLVAAAAVAEAFPVPIEGVAVGATSLATIFLVAVAAIYGWAPRRRSRGSWRWRSSRPAAPAAQPDRVQLRRVRHRRHRSRCRGRGLPQRRRCCSSSWASIAAAVCFYLVDITLLSAVVSRSRRLAFPPSLLRYI